MNRLLLISPDRAWRFQPILSGIKIISSESSPKPLQSKDFAILKSKI
jgi:hypothetical protein